MKTKLTLISILTITMGLSSCSIFKKTGKESPEVKKEAVLPTDRESIVQPVNAVYTSSDLAKGIVKGEWAIEKVNGKNAVGEKAPFINFVPSEGKIYGNNGCNVINGEYTYNPEDSTIRFSYLSSTMMLCHKEGITDMEINLALDSARYYTWKLEGDDYYINFYNENHESIMELMHQNFQFLNGTWEVKQINDESINNPEMKMVIDVDEGKIHGNTGCNIFNGSLEINMNAPNSISFQGISKTMMLCPDMSYETVLMVALEEAIKAKPLKGDKVELLDSQDKTVLVLQRTSDK